MVFNKVSFVQWHIEKYSSVMVLTTDSSHTSWGVTFENKSTNGEWSMEERKEPINWLDLQTVLLGLQSFLSSSCGGIVIKMFCVHNESLVLRIVLGES